jgi:hypothetical protein
LIGVAKVSCCSLRCKADVFQNHLPVSLLHFDLVAFYDQKLDFS